MRKIVIPYNGYIESKKIHGPVTFPYMETTKEIRKMLSRGVNVLEVLPDGERKELTLSNLVETESKVKEHRKVEHTAQVAKITPSQKQLSKKERKKLKQEQSKQNKCTLDFEIDVLESK